MFSSSKPLIAVPVHIKDVAHCDDFVSTIKELQKHGANQYPWYLDVNGCPPNINTAIQSSFGSDHPNIHVHIEPSGGRPSAMNRALQRARNMEVPHIIYTNDDLRYDMNNLPFDPLYESLQSGGKALVGAISAPYDPGFEYHPGIKRYQLSTSLVAEHYFYEKMRAQRGYHFRGDCFGMETELITVFPLGIAADDTYLSLMHQAKYGCLPHIVEEAKVTREQETTVKGSAGRLMRYLQGRNKLVEYLKEQSACDPIYARACDIAAKSLPLATKETLLAAESRFRILRQNHSPERLREAVQQGNYPKAREIYGPFADATVYRAAIRGVVRGEGPTSVSNSGEVTWSRSIQRK